MRLYTKPHQFYCGIDLYARSMHLCILDQAGTILVQQNFAAEPHAFLQAIAPYRDGLVVACECMFAWYWLADLCSAQQIPFVLGHALYMKAIHGGKTKNDKIDAHKIATLLRGGTLAQAYVYPQGMRETRDLLRRRSFLVRRRAELHPGANATRLASVGRSSSTPPIAANWTCPHASPSRAPARWWNATWP